MGAILPIVMSLAPVILPEIAKWFNKPGNTDWLGGLLNGGGSASGSLLPSDPEVGKQLARIATALEALLPKGLPQPVA